MNPLFAAIDTAEMDVAENLVRQLGGIVGGFKLGLQFWNANGPSGVMALRQLMTQEKLFLDLKLHDIPNTVGGATSSLAKTDFDILTVHAGGGQAMMEAARGAAPEAAKVVGVTVLTSFGDDDLKSVGVNDTAAAQVERLARLAKASGLDGMVCSPLEVAARRSEWADGLLVVPGIRPEGAAKGDQKRTLPPGEALAAGADILVIGRPITAASDPRAAAEEILASLS